VSAALDRPAPIAAARHTWILLAILAAITLSSARAHGGAPLGAAPGQHLVLYGSLLVGEWLLFLATWRGLAAYGTPPASLFGDGLRSARGRWLALLVGLGALAGIRLAAWAVQAALSYLGAPVAADAARVTAQIAPHGPLESALWVVLSLSAGIVEEFVYRGYFQRQFAAWLGGPVRGLLASALLFGLGHAYQGPWQVILIALAYGVPMGLVTRWARGLGPTIVAHAFEDILAGLVRGA